MDQMRIASAAVVVGESAEVVRAAVVLGDDIKLDATDSQLRH